jgi:guanylate kinase
MNKTSGKLFLISASSGAGKTTLVREVIARFGDIQLKRVITYTTKAPRPGEQDGIDYHFLSESEFIKKIEGNFFVEHSTVYGAYYGFPRSVLYEVEIGSHFIGIVDRAGAASIKAAWPAAVLIWIQPPDQDALEKRLHSRAQDNDATIAFRLEIARQESIEDQALYQHRIINDDLNIAVDVLHSLMKLEIGL